MSNDNAFDTTADFWASSVTAKRLSRRHRQTTLLKVAGITAISIALSAILLLVGSITYIGYQAFSQTVATVDVYLDPDLIDENDVEESRWRGITRGAVASLFPEDAAGPRDPDYRGIISRGGENALRRQLERRITANPDLIGQTIQARVQVADNYDQLAKGRVDREAPTDRRELSDRQIAMFDGLEEAGRIDRVFNKWLFINPDSRFPETAGLWGGLKGSFYALMVCLLISFPVGISAAIYLEEFAPKNRWTDLIEVNINNLAAVPSIVFGLLGLAVFLNVFGLPRSAPLVGGMVLALLTLPTIIIATRASLKAVPPSIREGAFGVGASPVQVVMHHVLPIAMPGILTGTIIGAAGALGETAPLLLIGMNTFITQAPDTVFSQSTALPTQIYIWFDSPERGFIARTAAAIIVLLGFLLVMNATAIFLRHRLEKK